MKEIVDPHRIGTYLDGFGLSDIIPPGLRKQLALFRFEPEEALCRQGEVPDYLHVLVLGKVKVFTNSIDGRTLLVNFTSPLGVIGDIECLRGRENLNTVTAVTAVETIGIHKRHLAQFVGVAPFLHFLLDEVTDKFYNKSISLSSNVLYPVEVRLASYLLSVSSGDGVGADSQATTANLKDTANLIGTSYRHLNRIVRAFCDHGLVARRRGKLVVIDREGLTNVAGRNIYEKGERES